MRKSCLLSDMPVLSRLRATLIGAVILCGSVIVLPHEAMAAEACEAHLIGEAPLRNDFGFLSVPVRPGGPAVSMVADTGSEGSLISPAVVRELNFPPDPHIRTMVSGTGGVAGVVPNVIVPDLEIGTLRTGPVSVPVGDLPSRPEIHPPVRGLLGADILLRHDVSFDPEERMIRFWHVPEGCAAFVPPGRWERIPAEFSGHRVVIPVRVDGHVIRALVDSGARSRILSVVAAEALGVTQERLARDPGGITSGIDGREKSYHWHRFSSLSVGSEVEKAPVLTVAPLAEDFGILLGADWFAVHHVWISRRAGALFFRKAESVRSDGDSRKRVR
ncbi:aspartyl protease family protein [Acetobacter sp. AN02]|uniref:retroviral-like aspartic protease family protein n=1 Tax=Acetobacter sp. AN02 TaxID=2894186 RepID=UPI0024344522|nr:retroviral-like aspartic protease family protein [Acetobacter sp. AN02]MDG6095547.1 aspartyl protease family protein [Acetobacter sp. AN02]